MTPRRGVQTLMAPVSRPSASSSSVSDLALYIFNKISASGAFLKILYKLFSIPHSPFSNPYPARHTS